jgi:uncharacterized protein (DUF433 family)
MKPEEVFMSDEDILGGTPVFTGTRVPVDSLIVHLKSDIALGEFIEDFPSVNRQQAVAFLEMAERAVLGGNLRANLTG